MTQKPKIVIIGAGLAGLSCAYYLEKKGYSPIIYEKAENPGGRIRTDIIKGFLLDRGFHILLSNYPEVNRLFSKKELKLKNIPSEAQIRYNQKWVTLENPLRNPAFLFKQTCPFFNFNDLFSLAKLYLAEFTSSPHQLHAPTIQFLKDKGTSEAFIEAFLRPFFGGIFLERELKTQAQIFLTMSKYFTTGLACLPEEGIQAIPLALQKKLQKTQIFYNQEVQSIDGQTINLNLGSRVQADFIIIATDCVKATHLVPFIPLVKTHSTTCLYFSITSDFISANPILYLNGTQQGPINNLIFPNLIQPSYAPSNQTLVSVSVIDPIWQTHSNLIGAVKEQLADWFKIKDKNWRPIHTYSISDALPDQSSPPLFSGHYCPHHPHLYLCGELVDEPSINGALYSGRKVAEYLHKII